MNIVQTIWNQIIAGGPIKVLSWGVPMKSRLGCIEENWLKFQVNGHYFKGIVKVTYCPVPDLYKVEFIQEKKKKGFLGGMETVAEVIETKKDIYCDMLTTVIDEYIEKIPEYKF